MSGYVGKISVRSNTSFIHNTLLLNYPNWTVPREKVILLLSRYWVLSLSAVFLRFNWNASLGVDDLGFDSLIYVPLPQSHWLIRFMSLNSLFTQLNVCICDSLLVWHMFFGISHGVDRNRGRPRSKSELSELNSKQSYLTLLLCDKGEIGKKNVFRSFPISFPFLSKVFPDVSLTICLVTTWPKSYICLTTCTSTIDPSLTRLYSTLTRSTSSSFADTWTSNEAFSLSWNTTSPWNVQRWHLKCALE